MTARTLVFPGALAAQVLQSAAKAVPHECCGLIEGADTDKGWRATAIHETANLAPDPERRFLIDPQAQFDLLRRLRGTPTRIVGCYHSHPLGEAKPSATDRADAHEPDFLYLIAGGGPGHFTLAAYVFDGAQGFSPIILV